MCGDSAKLQFNRNLNLSAPQMVKESGHVISKYIYLKTTFVYSLRFETFALYLNFDKITAV